MISIGYSRSLKLSSFVQVFIVDVRANKKQIKEAVARLYDIQTQKINTLIRSVTALLPNEYSKLKSLVRAVTGGLKVWLDLCMPMFIVIKLYCCYHCVGASVDMF